MRIWSAALPRILSLLLLIPLGTCVPPSAQSLLPIKIHATSAAYPWLETAFDCVPPSAAIVLSAEPEADMVLRLGEPRDLTGPAYQIGEDDLLVVTHPEVGIGPLPISVVEALFAGQVSSWSEVGGADQPVQVWSYSRTTDIQAYFDRIVLHDRPVSSMARLAVSAQHMSDSVGSIPGSIGLLPRRWKAGNTHEAVIVSSVPVLAMVRQAPQGALAELIGCMQAKR